MGSFGMMLCLLMLVMVTSTWSSSSEHRKDTTATELTKHHEHLIRRYLRNEINDEMMIKNHEDSMENLIRRYLRHEANRLGRSNGRFGRKNRRSLTGIEEKDSVPFSARRFEKMLEKAILKIITGDLSTADIMLLKSFNYSLEEILAIRERELGKKMKKSHISEVLKDPQRFDATKIDQKIIESGQTLTESSKHKESEGNNDSEIGTKDSSTVSSSLSSKKTKQNDDNPDVDFDFDAYNRQAIYDYENGANNMSQQSEMNPLSSIVEYEDRFKDIEEVTEVDDNRRMNFDRAMEPHVVFKIRYDDSEFDSTSDERARQLSKERGGASISFKTDNQNLINPRAPKDRAASLISSKGETWSPSKLSSLSINTTPGEHEDKPFQSSTHVDMRSSLPVVYRLGNFLTPHEMANNGTTEECGRLETSEKALDTRIKNESVKSIKSEDYESSSSALESDNVQVDLLVKNKSSNEFPRSVYEGLEWVEDDVFRVIPQAIDVLNYDNSVNDVDNDTIEELGGNGNRTSDSSTFFNDKNDTTNFQNETPEDDDQSQLFRTNSSTRMPLNTNLSTYQQLALAHRKDQGQKAIEDIKLKVLAMTGRFNLSSSSNQVQRERLTMFSPTCQAPRNTDLETWSDPFSMNMYFQFNLTSGDHVVAAKMRIYKLPQANITVLSSAAAVEEEDDEEKKIRISVYFYTKSLKKHRSKKRLMDSVVTALTSQGSHLALDVRQALRFWRQNVRSSAHGNNSNNSNNHGLVLQVEDQDGRPLKPSHYIQQDSCHASEQNEDDKAYQRNPALFVQACSRYVRVVNGETVTYVNCNKSLRNDRH